MVYEDTVRGDRTLFAFGLFKHLVKLNFLFILRMHAALLLLLVILYMALAFLIFKQPHTPAHI